MIIHPAEAQSMHVAAGEGTENPHRSAESGVTSISMAGLGTNSSRE